MTEQGSTMDTQLARALHSLEKSEERTRLLSGQLRSTQSKLKEVEKRLSKLETTKAEVSSHHMLAIALCWGSGPV